MNARVIAMATDTATTTGTASTERPSRVRTAGAVWVWAAIFAMFWAIEWGPTTRLAAQQQPQQPAPADAERATAAAAKMATLNWRTDGLAVDRGSSGAALRNWDAATAATDGSEASRRDIFIVWPEPTRPLVAVDIYFAWRMFPAPLLTQGPRFDAELARAMFSNETAQTKRVRITGEAAMQGRIVDRWRLNGAPDYYYVKIVGITAAGDFVDVLDASVGSAEYRENPRHELPAAPAADVCVSIDRPRGDREMRTRWEPYGTKWAPGHEPQMQSRRVAPANADPAEKLGALNWETNDGAYHDGGLGRVVRVWNTTGHHRGRDPLFIEWKPDPQSEWRPAQIDIYFGWRMFPAPRLTAGNRFFDADYARALVGNETAQAKRLRVAVPPASGPANSRWFVDRPADNGPIDYYYVKLVGVTADGRFFDLANYSVGSEAERRDPRFALDPVPANVAAVSVSRPNGDRDAITRWEPYGTHYAPGHEPPAEPKTYPPAEAELVAKLAALTWDTNGGMSSDSGQGTALRVWDTAGNARGSAPLFVTWGAEQLENFQAIDIYFAWRNFAAPRFNAQSRHFDADYLSAVYENRTAQTKRVRIPAPAGRAVVDRPADNGRVDYYYVKLVGVTADERFFDVVNWEVGDAERRADPRWHLTKAPADAEPIARPAGNRNVKTRWEPYGTSWAEGHQPPVVRPTYPPGTADVAEKLGALNWETNGGRAQDDGRYTALRNWECVGDAQRHDVMIMWDDQPEPLVAIDVYVGWRMFAVARLTSGATYFDADYARALFENRTGQAARLRIATADVPQRALIDRVAENGPNDWYYAKLVGVTADGRFVDVVNWSLGSRDYRADAQRDLPAPAANPLPIRRPAGNREWRTPWEPSGSAWKPGYEPPPPPRRTYPPATAEVAEKLGALNWETNGGASRDDGRGTALRNWEIGPYSGRDIFIVWGPQPEPLREIVVVYAWRNFAHARMTKGTRYFDADYLQAVWANETAQTKHLRISAETVPHRVLLDRGSVGRPHDWYYAKLIGVTDAGQFVDIVDWSLGSRDYRADPQLDLPAAPPRETAVAVDRPEGHRNLKTKWEPYGTEWAPGHEPPGPEYHAGTVPQQMVQLNWTMNGSNGDGGRGTGCRVWAMDRDRNADVIFTFAEQARWGDLLVAIDVYVFAGLPPTIFDPRTVAQRANALQALFDNQTANAKRIRVTVADLGGKRVFIDRVATNGPIDYRYAKLVGVLSDGRFVDLTGYEIENLSQRRLRALPAEWATAPTLDRR